MEEEGREGREEEEEGADDDDEEAAEGGRFGRGSSLRLGATGGTTDPPAPGWARRAPAGARVELTEEASSVEKGAAGEKAGLGVEEAKKEALLIPCRSNRGGTCGIWSGGGGPPREVSAGRGGGGSASEGSLGASISSSISSSSIMRSIAESKLSISLSPNP